MKNIMESKILTGLGLIFIGLLIVSFIGNTNSNMENSITDHIKLGVKYKVEFIKSPTSKIEIVFTELTKDGWGRAEYAGGIVYYWNLNALISITEVK